MAKQSAAWKDFERWIAKESGGKRRGAHTGEGFKGSGLSDVILEGFSLECKKLRNPLPGDMTKALAQAEAAKESPNDYAIAFIARNGSPYRDAMSLMRWSEFFEMVDAHCWSCIPGKDELCIYMRAGDMCELIKSSLSDHHDHIA
jgi:hypothetical protein